MPEVKSTGHKSTELSFWGPDEQSPDWIEAKIVERHRSMAPDVHVTLPMWF